MKKILLFISVVLITATSFSQFTSATLQASGLTCSLCSKAVKVALEEVVFVKEVNVDIKNQEYSIIFKENTDIDFDALKNADLEVVKNIWEKKTSTEEMSLKNASAKNINPTEISKEMKMIFEPSL